MNIVSVSSNAPTDDEIMVMTNGVPIISMMDTGTHYTLLRFSEYQRIGNPPIQAVRQSFYGLGKSQVIPIGIFWADLVIQGEQYKIEVYVVPNDAMEEKMLLGKELTRQMDVRMTGGILSIKKLEDVTKKEDKEKESGNQEERNGKDDSKDRDDKESKEENKGEGEEGVQEIDHTAREENRLKEEDRESYEETIRELYAVNYMQKDLVDVDEQYRHRIQQL